MKKVIRLTESDLVRLVKKVISEQTQPMKTFYAYCQKCKKSSAPITSTSVNTAAKLRVAIDGENYDVPRFFTSLNTFDEFCGLVKSFNKNYGELYQYMKDEYGTSDDEDVWHKVSEAILELSSKGGKRTNFDNGNVKTNPWKPGDQSYNW